MRWAAGSCRIRAPALHRPLLPRSPHQHHVRISSSSSSVSAGLRSGISLHIPPTILFRNFVRDDHRRTLFLHPAIGTRHNSPARPYCPHHRLVFGSIFVSWYRLTPTPYTPSLPSHNNPKPLQQSYTPFTQSPPGYGIYGVLYSAAAVRLRASQSHSNSRHNPCCRLLYIVFSILISFCHSMAPRACSGQAFLFATVTCVSLCNCDVCGRQLLRWLPRHQYQQVHPSPTTNKSQTLNPNQICSLAQTIGLRSSNPPAPGRHVPSHVFFGRGKGAYSISTPCHHHHAFTPLPPPPCIHSPATTTMHSLLAGWAAGCPGGGFGAAAAASA